jgi:hypothetical protein
MSPTAVKNQFQNSINSNLNIRSKTWRGLSFFNINSSDFSFFDLALHYNHNFVSQPFDLLYIVENYKPIDKKIKSNF